MGKKVRLAVIGAGAAGMTAAVTAAQNGAEVTIYEKNDRVGKKLLATGNGKCNLSNLDFSMDHYYCEDKRKLNKLFHVFSVWDTITFFESCGLMIRDKNGYLYPYSEQASSVLDVLRMQLKREGIETITDTEIAAVRKPADGRGFIITEKDRKERAFDKVIVACGGPASLKKKEGMTGFEIARSFGHRIKQVVPGLVQLRSDEGFLKALAGVRTQAKIWLYIGGEATDCEKGELQFTDYGVSGIPVFQLSRQAAYALAEKKKVKVRIDFFPDQEEQAFYYLNRLRFEAQKDKTLEDYLTGTANKKINMVMLKQAGLKPGMKAEEAGFKRISELMNGYRSFEIHISEVNSMENAQICAGGVDFGQISTEMESMLVKGLYFAGELVDVDGKCGGYNLQWAWTSGYIAGRNAAGNSTKEIADCEEDELLMKKGAPLC